MNEGKPYQSGLCTESGLGNYAYEGAYASLSGDGLLSIDGDAGAIQVTSMDIDELAGTVIDLEVDGSIDCGGVCGGGGTADGVIDIEGGGEIEFIDVFMEEVDISIDTDGSVDLAYFGIDDDTFTYYSCGSGEGVSDLSGYAAGADSVAVGPQTKATGLGVAMGADVIADGEAGIAIGLGRGVAATGNRAVALGKDVAANGTGSVAVGSDSAATGTDALAIGKDSTAIGDRSLAMGQKAEANGTAAACTHLHPRSRKNGCSQRPTACGLGL